MKTVKNIYMREIVNNPDITVIYKMYWVAPIREDILQKVLYDLISS